jgi:hypothetical protein
VLSGASATLSVSQAQNYVNGTTTTLGQNGNPNTVTATTATLNTGLTINVNGAWHDSTVYGNLAISLNDLLGIDKFITDTTTGNTVQLPRTNTRSLSTQIRVRPGDSILIGGLVTQKDNYSGSGPGFSKPLLETSRDSQASNTELVFLLRPRVVIYEAGDDSDTPPVVNAPKEGIIPSAADLKANGSAPISPVAAMETAPAPESAKTGGTKAAPLPEGISPVLLAPEAPAQATTGGATPLNDGGKTAPALLSVPADDMAPVPIAPLSPPSGKKKGGKR